LTCGPRAIEEADRQGRQSREQSHYTMEEFERLQIREFWIMEQDVKWTRRLE
jgi:hypothetical protein